MIKHEINEAFIRKAYKSACTDWKRQIIEECPELFHGWFESTYGNKFVWISKDKSFAIEEVSKDGENKWIISNSQLTYATATSVRENPNNWTKIDPKHNSGLTIAISHLLRDYKIDYDTTTENIVVKDRSIEVDRGSLSLPTLVWFNGEWGLEKKVADPKIVKFKNCAIEVNHKVLELDYYIAYTPEYSIWFEKTVAGKYLEDEPEAYIYSTLKEAQDKAAEMNWTAGDIYWVNVGKEIRLYVATERVGYFKHNDMEFKVPHGSYRKAAGGVYYKNKEEI